MSKVILQMGRRNMSKRRLFTAAFIGLLTSAPAFAHKPFFSDGVYGSPEVAYEVDDITTSIVLYHEVTCEAPQLWMTFQTAGNDEPFFLQLGIPVIDWLSDYRPSIALFAPGLPQLSASVASNLPFSIPDGLGALVWSPGEEREFFEPFTSTNSEILVEETVVLPEEGRGYLVAWHPQALTGKLWAAVGTEERFGPADFADLPRAGRIVQAFHEVGGSAPTSATSICGDN